jgi:hypothetical protein
VPTNRYTPEANRRGQKRIQCKKRLLIQAHKAEQGCRRCGEKDPIVLDMHHLDPALQNPKLSLKRDGVTKRGKGSWQSKLSFEEIVIEFTRCEVLCANCHRREHWGEKHSA